MFEKISTHKIVLLRDRLILLLMVVGITGLAAHAIHSFDVFWQLQSGKYMWQQGEIIRTDIFSLAADVERCEHCLLHYLIIYVKYRKAG